MGSKKKILLLLVTVFILILVAISFYWYNKPPTDVRFLKGEHITATNLYGYFLKDSISAKNRYINQILEVSGMVSQVGKNQQQHTIVLLQTNSPSAAINCTLEKSLQPVKAGQQIVMRGICTGMGEGDAAMGIMGDVYLVRCYVMP